MRIDPKVHLHYGNIASLTREELPVDASRGFEKGFEYFLDYFFLACTEQELPNYRPDGATYIDFNLVCTNVLNYVNDSLSHFPFKGDIKEFWQGYFFAQEMAQKIFYIAYSPGIEAA